MSEPMPSRNALLPAFFAANGKPLTTNGSALQTQESHLHATTARNTDEN